MWKMIAVGAGAGIAAYKLSGMISSKFVGAEESTADTIKNTAIVYGTAGAIGGIVALVASKVLGA